MCSGYGYVIEDDVRLMAAAQLYGFRLVGCYYIEGFCELLFLLGLEGVRGLFGVLFIGDCL